MQPEGAQPNYNPKTLEKDIVYNTNQISLFPSKDEARSNGLVVKKINQEIIRIQSPPEGLQSKPRASVIQISRNLFFSFSDP